MTAGRVAHGLVAAVGAVAALVASGLAWLGVSLCSMAGGRCTGEQLAAADALAAVVVLVVVVGVAGVVVAARAARWPVTAGWVTAVVALGGAGLLLAR